MTGKNRLRLGAGAALLVLVLLLAPRLGDVKAADILACTPSRPVPAALFLLALFTVKGLTFFLPLAVLEAAAGLLFPLPWALGINLAGIACAVTLPFFLGRRRQGGLDALLRRFPKLRAARDLRAESGDFLCVFLLRLTGVLPCDGVSLMLGAAGVPYGVYLSAGMLGMAPHTVAATFLGSALSDPTSEAFFISIAANAAISVGALAVWRCRNGAGAPKSHKRRGRTA